MKKKILITGSNGQLGNCLSASLSNYFDVIPSLKNTTIGSLKLDITDKLNVKYIIDRIKPDIIINCAAITDVDLCEKNRAQARNVNFIGLKNLVKYSKKHTKLIHISTDYVFDGLKGNYNEKDPTIPLNFYGKTKLEAENFLIGSNRKILILRLNGLFSSKLKNKNFFSFVYKSINANRKISIVDDQISNPVLVELMPEVIMKAILLDTTGVVHYGSSNVISRYDFAKQICMVFKLNALLIEKISSDKLNQLAKRPLKTSLDTSKIESILEINTYDTNFCLELIKTKYILK
ncbi:MAG: NAD(P)-dependent oxidoreductase [Candidatus Marinimicrobia bacterium]|nr:NAD(P)-dependent oxidoreductase [Candidatus Neomarinimicrobiota bacterium]